MAPRNKWGVLLSWSSIELLVGDAVYAILGRAYVNEALCLTEPVLQVATHIRQSKHIYDSQNTYTTVKTHIRQSKHI